MKVEGPNRTSSPKDVKKAGVKNTGDGAFDAMVNETEEAEVKAPVARTAPVGALDTLLALQGAEEAGGEAAKKAKKHANDLLDQMEKIKIGLLTGSLPKSTIEQLSQMVARHRREAVLDPKLAGILDDIELRAQVELAKLDNIR